MINPMSMVGKVIIVTGAASGIGKECARLLSGLGAKLLLLDRNEEGLNSIKRELDSSDSPVVVKAVDLANLDRIMEVLLEAKK